MHATGEYQAVFTGERRQRLDTLLTRYPTKRAALLPALWIVQEAHGWISDAAMVEVARALDLTAAYVKGVVTFWVRRNPPPCTTSTTSTRSSRPLGTDQRWQSVSGPSPTPDSSRPPSGLKLKEPTWVP